MEELTPIEQSRADTGYRYYKVHPDVYVQLAGQVDEDRGYPYGSGSEAITIKGLRPLEDLSYANDASGFVIVPIDCWRFTPNDEEGMQPAKDASLLIELTYNEYIALQPPTEEI